MKTKSVLLLLFCLIIPSTIWGGVKEYTAEKWIPFDEDHFPDPAVRDWLNANKGKYVNSALGHPDNIVQEIDGVMMVNVAAVNSWPTAYDYIEKIEDMSCARYFINLGSITLTNSWKKLKKLNVSGLDITKISSGISEDATGTGAHFDSLEEAIAENCPKLTTVNLSGCRNLREVSFTGSKKINSININMNGATIKRNDTIVNHKLHSLDFAGFPELRGVSKFSNNKDLRVARMSHTDKYLMPTGYSPQYHFNNTAVEEFDISQLGYDIYGGLYAFAFQFYGAPIHNIITRDEGLEYSITCNLTKGQLPTFDIPTTASFGSSTQTKDKKVNHKYTIQGNSDKGYHLKRTLKAGAVINAENCHHDRESSKLHLHDGYDSGKYTFHTNQSASGAAHTGGHTFWTVELSKAEAPALFLVNVDENNQETGTHEFTYLGSEDYELDYKGVLEGKFRIKVVPVGKDPYYLGPVRHDLVTPATAINADGSPLFDLSTMSVKDYNNFDKVAHVLNPHRIATAKQNGSGYYNGVYTELQDDRVKEDYYLDKDSPYYFSTHESVPDNLTSSLKNPRFEVRYNGTHNTGHLYTYGKDGVVTGVDSVGNDDSDNGTDVEWYDLNGVKVDAGNLQPGIYIKIENKKSEKVVIE